MTDFYVYVHRKATTGEIFYVGKGTGYRAYEFGRNRHWNNTAKKHGYTVETIEIGLQEWYAFELEMNLISYHGRCDLGLGVLVNLTDGGEGSSNPSKETRNLMSAAHKGNTTALGYKHTAKTKARLREAVETQRVSKIGLFGLSLEDRVRHGKDKVKNNIGFHKEEHKGKGAQTTMLKKIGLFSFSTDELSKCGSKGASKANSLRVTCAECGMISNPGAIGRHHKYSGHSGVVK